MLRLEREADPEGVVKSYFVASRREMTFFNIKVEEGDALYEVFYMSNRSNIGKISIDLTQDITLPKGVKISEAFCIFEDLIRESVGQLVTFTTWDEVQIGRAHV